jgi:hypothetical protein
LILALGLARDGQEARAALSRYTCQGSQSQGG